MAFITLDFETYYDNDFSLSKLTTEEYINDSRFEVIGVGVKVDDAPAEWFTGSKEEIKHWLGKFNWAESALLCHNTMFDGAILSWVFGVVPAYYFDTLCMARAVHGVDVGGSLKSLVERYQLGAKGTEVINAKGLRREDFSPEQLQAYGEYCKNDVELTFKLFAVLHPFPSDEHALIDMTLRMYTQPVFDLDDGLLVDRLEKLRAEKRALLGGLMEDLGCPDEESVRKKLASNPQFAKILVDMGIDPPMKISPVTGKQTFAFAKNDISFLELSEHENLVVQQLCAVRLGTKSTIEESRVERFIGIGARNKGKLPIPLKYYGAHTGRWSGIDGLNLQNLPSRDKEKKSLKRSIVAPPGHVVINCDSSQIEARVLAWLAGQDDVTEQFRKGEDVYSIFATKIYKKPISKANPIERFVGKTCVLGLGYGTGAVKLQHTLKTQPPGADLSEEECKRIILVYRNSNQKITAFWKHCEYMLDLLLARASDADSENTPDNSPVLRVTNSGIRLPNGLSIRYPGLRLEDGAYVYDSRKGPMKLWGGAVTENIVQALARIVVAKQMLAISLRYRVVLTVHDAAVIVVPESEQDDARRYMEQCMTTPPQWAPTLPVACESKMGRTYGDC